MHPALPCREAKFLQMLHHPNIVDCYDVVEDEKQMVILMEWLRGGHLLDTLEEMSGQHYSEQQAAILFVQVCHLVAQPPQALYQGCNDTASDLPCYYYLLSRVSGSSASLWITLSVKQTLAISIQASLQGYASDVFSSAHNPRC